jgi:hypothetical protein
MTQDIVNTVATAGFESLLILLRVGERTLISMFVVASAIIIMLAYRNKIQNIDIDLANPSGSLKTTASLAMPVFVLLALILYAYVVFSNPISITSSRALQEPGTSANSASGSLKTKDTAFLGNSGDGDALRSDILDLSAVVYALRELRRLSLELDPPENAALTTIIDGMGQAVRKLDVSRKSSLLDRFGQATLDDCLPKALDQFAFYLTEECSEFNTYLFE